MSRTVQVDTTDTVRFTAERLDVRVGETVASKFAIRACSQTNSSLALRVATTRLALRVFTAEFARRLWLSEGTVRNQISEILGKLGVRNRAEAVQIARDKGWL